MMPIEQTNALREELATLQASHAALDRMLAAAQRDMKRLAAERDQARQALADRKIIERAKGLLMEQRQLSEDAAYHHLRRTAMNEGKRMAEIARTIVATPSVALGSAGSTDRSDDPLHPTGRCTCAGEGRCEWCRWREGQPSSARFELCCRDCHHPASLHGGKYCRAYGCYCSERAPADELRLLLELERAVRAGDQSAGVRANDALDRLAALRAAQQACNDAPCPDCGAQVLEFHRSSCPKVAGVEVFRC